MPNILLIEDYLSLQTIYKEALELEKYTVYVAANAEEGLAAAKQHDIDLILLDLLLQQSWGIDFLTEFDLSAHPGTKIIVISNLFTTELLNKVLQLGAKQYLIKSEVTPQQLVAVVRETLEEAAAEGHDGAP